jgi:hypothetical protein
MVVKHRVLIKTNQKVEDFKGFWENETIVRRVLAKFRPNSEILLIERIYPDHEVIFDSSVGGKPTQ